MRLAGFQGDHLFGAAPKYQDDKIEKKILTGTGSLGDIFPGVNLARAAFNLVVK